MRHAISMVLLLGVIGGMSVTIVPKLKLELLVTAGDSPILSVVVKYEFKCSTGELKPMKFTTIRRVAGELLRASKSMIQLYCQGTLVGSIEAMRRAISMVLLLGVIGGMSVTIVPKLKLITRCVAPLADRGV